jgi:hypothetical protein
MSVRFVPVSRSIAIYTTNDWDFLVQPNIEGQWFKRKAHPLSHLPRGLRDFVRDRLRQDDDILRGLTTFGSFQKPEEEVPLVVVCPAVWASKMHAFIGRLRQGYQRYRGMETTFGVRFGTVTTIITETHEYETKLWRLSPNYRQMLGPSSSSLHLSVASAGPTTIHPITG